MGPSLSLPELRQHETQVAALEPRITSRIHHREQVSGHAEICPLGLISQAKGGRGRWGSKVTDCQRMPHAGNELCDAGSWTARNGSELQPRPGPGGGQLGEAEPGWGVGLAASPCLALALPSWTDGRVVWRNWEVIEIWGIIIIF